MRPVVEPFRARAVIHREAVLGGPSSASGRASCGYQTSIGLTATRSAAIRPARRPASSRAAA